MSSPIATISIMGAGWLGLPLGSILAGQGYHVRGSTTRSEKLSQLRIAGLEPFLISIDDQVEGEHLSEFFSSEVLILNLPPGRRQSGLEEHYPEKIRAVCRLAESGGVRYLLFTSSTSVYPDLNRLVREADEVSADGGSALGLIRAETLLRQQTAFKVTILRLAGLAGGERRAGRFLAGKQDVPNPEGPVNLVHLDDCIGIIHEVLRQEKWGEIYNVCADEHPSRRVFYTEQALKEKLAPPLFRESEEGSFKIVSNRKVKEALGYTFKHPDPERF